MKIAICEDNKELLGVISEIIECAISDNKLDAEIVFTSNNYNDMDRFIKSNEVDLYLLDVDLKSDNIDNNGLRLAECVVENKKNKFILFITGSPVNMNRLFELKVYNCLTKPINIEYLISNVLKIYQEFRCSIDNNECIVNIPFSNSNKISRVICSDIIHVDKISDICIIYTRHIGKVETNMTLQQISDMCKNLARVHKSFVCNVDDILSVDYTRKEVTMRNGNTILLGGKYKVNLLKLLKV